MVGVAAKIEGTQWIGSLGDNNRKGQVAMKLVTKIVVVLAMVVMISGCLCAKAAKCGAGCSKACCMEKAEPKAAE